MRGCPSHGFVEVVVVLLGDVDPAVAKGGFVGFGEGVAVADDDEGLQEGYVRGIRRVAADDEVGLLQGFEGDGVRREVAGGEDYDIFRLSFLHLITPRMQKTSKTA